MATETKPVLIIGGGVAGLTAALHLTERGVPVTVLEAHETEWGGRLRDEAPIEIELGNETWSFPSEHAIHGIWFPYNNFRAMLARHNITPEFVPAQDETWVLVHGNKIKKARIGKVIRESWLPAPFHYLSLFARPSFINMLQPIDFLAGILIGGNLMAATAVDPIGEQRAIGTMTLADFTKGWSYNIRNLFFGLSRNALAAHPEDAPAAGFIAFLRFYTLMRREAWGFNYFAGTGGSSVIQPMVEKIKAQGGKMQLGSFVTELKQMEVGWQVTYSQAGETHNLTAPQVVVALDSPATAKLLQNSTNTAQVAGKLQFPIGVPTAICRLWFERQPKKGAEAGILSGTVTGDNFFWLHRLQPVYQEWADQTGGSALESHIYGPPELLEKPDFLLGERIRREVEQIFPELAGWHLHTDVARNPATHTLFTVFPAGQHLAVTTPWPSLYACGDWVYYDTPALYLERATVTGIAAANGVLQEQGALGWEIMPAPEPEWLAKQVSRLFQLFRRVLGYH